MQMIDKKIGRVYKVSSIYETEPWGFDCDQNFLNQVIAVDTHLNPHETLDKALEIENELGRKHTSIFYESRPIDVDILMFDDIIYNDASLQIPHPRMHERNFTLIPLAEIAGEKKHPVFERTIDDLVSHCTDQLHVTKFSTATSYEI